MKFNKHILLAIVFAITCKALAAEQSAVEQDYIERFYKACDISKTTIHQLPKEEQTEIIEHYRTIDPHLEVSDKIKCINLIHNIPEEERENTLDIVKHIKTHASPSYLFNKELIKGIAEIEQTKRQHVIKHIESLFNRVPITESLINSIAEIPMDQTQEVINYTLDIVNCAIPLTEQEMWNFIFCENIRMNICEIITPVAKLDPTRRKDIINDIKPLIAFKMTSEHIAGIIKAVDALPDKDRKEIISITEDITIAKQGGYKILQAVGDPIHDVIEAINKIPHYDKQEFINTIKPIAIIYMHNCYMAGVIKKMSKVPIHLLNKVIKNIRSELRPKYRILSNILERDYCDEMHYIFDIFKRPCMKENYMRLSKL